MRSRREHLRLWVFLVLALIGGLITAGYWFRTLAPGSLPAMAFPFVAASAILWIAASWVANAGRRRVVFNWQAGTVRWADQVARLGDIRSLTFRTEEIGTVSDLGHRVPKQAWALDVDLAGAGRSRLALHESEYPLFYAARKLALRLRVRMYDRCGPEGTETVWDPGDLPPVIRTTGAVVASAAPGLSRETVREGMLLTWASARDGDLTVIGIGGTLALGLAAVGGLSRGNVGVVFMVLAALAAAFPVLLLVGVVVTIDALTVGRDHLILHHRGRPAFRARRVSLQEVRAVRLSRIQTRGRPGTGGTDSAPTHVDLIGPKRRLVRMTMSSAEALVVIARVQEALRPARSRTETDPKGA